MKCPHCKEEFLMSEYNKTGRCSECGYNLKEDQNVQNIMVRKMQRHLQNIRRLIQ